MQNINNNINLFLINKNYLDFVIKVGVKCISDFKYGIGVHVDNMLCFVPIDLEKGIDYERALDSLLFICMLPIKDLSDYAIKQEIKIDSNEFDSLSKLNKLLVLFNNKIDSINYITSEIYYSIINQTKRSVFKIEI